MFDHEKLPVYGKAFDFAAQAAAWTSNWEERAFLVETEATAGKEILCRIIARVAGF